MPHGAVRWVLEPQDVQRLTSLLGTFLHESSARCAMVIDRTGQLLVVAGESPGFDTSAFAALTAATFAANDQLAFLIGEREFTSLAHQGTQTSIFLADIERLAVLAVLFDQRATLGMVRLRAKSTTRALTIVLAELRERPGRLHDIFPGRGFAAEVGARLERPAGLE
jgi:predicted regulator of Ras-like GTPase activity (Roadblock/LC7/MglB family)